MIERKPEWLRVKFHGEKSRTEVEELMRKLNLHTVCEEANCPNLGECFSRKTATFMILGRNCTRNCTFCNVQKDLPQPVDPEEPVRVAQAVKELDLRHVVITSVTRDDLPDGGAGCFADVIKEIRKSSGEVVIEVLIPDFKGDAGALEKVVRARPEIINHNIETIPRLYPEVRPMADYGRSLKLLENVKHMDAGMLTKSGIMVGLGEKEEEVLEVFMDLRKADCDLLTIGQYLAPSRKHHPVIEYVHPDTFEKYRAYALKAGFRYVASAPLVRSSYLAEQALKSIEHRT